MLPNMTSMKRFTGKKDQLHIVIFFLFSLYLLIMARLHNWLAQEVPVHTPFSSGVQFSVSSSSQKQKPLREQSKEHAAIMPNATTERVSPRSKGPERDRTNDLDSSRPMNPFLSTTGNQIPFIYKKGNWDGAPIVVEEYKLVFFTQAKVCHALNLLVNHPNRFPLCYGTHTLSMYL
jgi:cytoskeletal protein RodZ